MDGHERRHVMAKRIPLPPPMRHLGRRITVHRLDGTTSTGILAAVDSSGIRVLDSVVSDIPYSLIDFAEDA
jgi:hypothetical protein